MQLLRPELRIIRTAPLLLLLVFVSASAAEENELRKNWFNDPFFQVRDAIKNCPEPRGPRLTNAQRLATTHSRAERGNSCWLAGKCKKSNSYMYDADIAQDVGERFRGSDAFKQTTLWVTVTARVVFVEGCASASFDDRALHDFLKTVPDVSLLVVNVTHGADAKPAYEVSDPAIDR